MWCRFKGSGWSPPSPISKFKPTSSEKFFFWEWLRANGYAGVGKTEDGVTETDKGGSWIRPAPCPYILYGWDFPSIALFQDKTNALCKLRGVDKFHPVTKEDIQAFKRKREVWFVGRSKLQRERVKVK
jgi:hypothetical protein